MPFAGHDDVVKASRRIEPITRPVYAFWPRQARRNTLPMAEIFLDDIIHKAHLEREIESRLAGVKTVAMGAGTGRFSLRLAPRGLAVTHVDISAQ